MNWFFVAFNKYANFSGRAQRSEYWYFFLFYFLIMIGVSILDAIMGSFSDEVGLGLLGGLLALVLLIPSIAVTVRRLHDTGRSGWWLLLALIPLIGAIVLFVFSVQDSSQGANSYGPNPKGIGA